MPNYQVVIMNEEGQHLNTKILSSYKEACTWAENADIGNTFSIYEDEPFLWEAGSHLVGHKMENGNIDWMRLPL